MDAFTGNHDGPLVPLIDFSTLPEGSEKAHLDHVERGSAMTLVLAVEELCRRLTYGASQISTPQLLSVADSLHRLSGAAAKKAAQQASAGSGFRLVIERSGGDTITVSTGPQDEPQETRQEPRTIDGEVVTDPEFTLPLRKAARAFDVTMDLSSGE